jgi:group I intron endonuclease
MLIYKITNLITGKFYIGQTRMPLKRRWAVHKASKRTSPLTSSIKKYGVDNFKIEEICKASSQDELNRLEVYYISSYKSLYPLGYNLSKGGYSGSGVIAWNKGKTGLKAPKSAFEKGHKTWNKGIPQLSEETRRKQSLAKLGKHISPDTEFKRGITSAFKGHKHTTESLKKISDNGNRRTIMCVNTGIMYPSIVAASKELKIAKSHLRRLALSGRVHMGSGLTFKLVDSIKP